MFTGVDHSLTSDESKHLGASLASHGSMGMFHVVSATPEARTLEDAFGEYEVEQTIRVTDRDIENVYSGYNV